MEALAVRRATTGDAEWIVDLSRRVQEALTAAESLQRIGRLSFAVVQSSVQPGNRFLLEAPSGRLGSVLVYPAPAWPALPATARLRRQHDGCP